MTLIGLLDRGENHARDILLRRRERRLQGFFHLVGPSEDRIVVADWQTDIQKQLALLEVKRLSHDLGAVAALIVFEAWMVKARTAVEAAISGRIAPSENPLRIEVVSLLATDGAEAKSRVLQIVRDKPGGRIVSLVEDPSLSNKGIGGDLVRDLIPRGTDSKLANPK